jgi:hypothetical protein
MHTNPSHDRSRRGISIDLLRKSTWGALVLLCGSLFFLGLRASAADVPVMRPSLEKGFRLLYNLDFVHAHEEFLSWQQQHPEDPLGPTCEAAGLLFSEFQRLGVLEGQFYEDNKAFESRRKLDPDPAIRDLFGTTLDRAESLARARLSNDSKNRDALFAMTLAAGLRADYTALVEKRNLASLHYTKLANDWAGQLLAVDPDCYDAHLATGVNNYIVGSMATPVRWLLRLDGVAGDKQKGMAQLQLTAEHGHFLAPFARIMLAIAFKREKDPVKARQVLDSLREEFPSNPLFAREIARIDAGH